MAGWRMVENQNWRTVHVRERAAPPARAYDQLAELEAALDAIHPAARIAWDRDVELRGRIWLAGDLAYATEGGRRVGRAYRFVEDDRDPLGARWRLAT